MKEQFVPYDLAIKLKEKGFDEECLAYWVDKDTLRSCGAILFEVDGFFKNSLSPEKYLIATPLWQQVIDWFREKHFIDIMIRQTQKDGTAYYKITKIETEDKIKGYSNFCKTVDIARQAVIELALTLI